MGVVRKILAWLSVAVICLLSLVLYLARPFNPDNNRLLAGFIARFCRRVLGMERPLYGAENMPQDRPTVIVANHQENDDLMVVGDLLPPRTVAVGKSDLLWIPFFGQVFWLGDNIILNRRQSHKAVAIMKATSDAINKDRKSIWVFAEGTRSRGQGLGRFKKGAFHMAIAAGAPITMVCVANYHGKTEGVLGRRGSVPVRILPPIETAGLTNADVTELMERCHKQMAEAVSELSGTSGTA
ncbi:1-acyl-sn-glycerol-3-phosphate acyltransferase [Marinobacter sp. JH2]|uniref:lysophospholipid acyltransferase family protein n=1 Tax=Marinobacter sp. AL4B TaxID=2871173 RepID=UPI0010562BAB|nr:MULTISPECIES: 1-acylglycerol-3-phosphate O-acyltransferase [unclassified Marinobacter]MBZ0335148.1 1-acylglycerol-3-phosphate O-acyltransferase [Marinobacter sp. AL4B]QBM18846.1 1-acyl-sn-glycerol-3-phosphate acyltransferase [Marinobacter sp. JH2]